jgi:hypothetical protein
MYRQTDPNQWLQFLAQFSQIQARLERTFSRAQRDLERLRKLRRAPEVRRPDHPAEPAPAQAPKPVAPSSGGPKPPVQPQPLEQVPHPRTS